MIATEFSPSLLLVLSSLKGVVVTDQCSVLRAPQACRWYAVSSVLNKESEACMLSCSLQHHQPFAQTLTIQLTHTSLCITMLLSNSC